MNTENIARAVLTDTVSAPLTKEEKFHNLVDPVIGIEPYESVFRSSGERSMSDDPKVRQAARREWLAFMRVHVTDYLSRWPDYREHLIAFLEHLLEVPRYLRPKTRADAEAVLAAARLTA
jgi:hypothetical protein